MRLLFALFVVLMVAGCTGRAQKDENKDRDRPKPAAIG